ncbi:MAG: hypothetical protein AAGA77_15255 [Bacteroidota bacterium]
MDINAKQEILAEYMNDVSTVFERIVSNQAHKSDYKLLEEYYRLAGISQQYIDNLYSSCGFDNSLDFFQQRLKPSNKQTGNVRQAISKLKGTTEAILEAIQYKLVRLNNFS